MLEIKIGNKKIKITPEEHAKRFERMKPKKGKKPRRKYLKFVVKDLEELRQAILGEGDKELVRALQNLRYDEVLQYVREHKRGLQVVIPVEEVDPPKIEPKDYLDDIDNVRTVLETIYTEEDDVIDIDEENEEIRVGKRTPVKFLDVVDEKGRKRRVKAPGGLYKVEWKEVFDLAHFRKTKELKPKAKAKILRGRRNGGAIE